MEKFTIPFVDLHAQYLTIKTDIDQAIRTVIDESSFIRGKHVDLFETNFAKLIGSEHCVSCANGTDAIYIAMRGLGIQPGDEVITTAHSWISTSETITQAGGKVVFCDTEPGTFTIDPDDVAKKINQKTKGIIPVHLYGHAVDMDPIMELSRKHKLWVIEDCAQAHLTKYKGKTVGTIGNAGTFSFYPGKNLGAMGDAGALVTNDKKLAEWCKLYARHGGKGEHLIEGINSRLDGMQAAILNVKLSHLKEWTRKRQDIANQYLVNMGSIRQIQLPVTAGWSTHSYHLFVVKTDRRDGLRDHLADAGIGTSINYPKALPYYPAYARFNSLPGDFPNAFNNQSKILSLPIYPEMNESDVTFVVEKIREFFN
jgi:dTDP-4-amino-4,6-dideoxygalactose transaminase